MSLVGLPAVIEEPVLDGESLDAEADSVFAELDRLRKVHSELNANLDQLATQYRIYFPNELRHIGDIEAAIQEEEIRSLSQKPESEEASETEEDKETPEQPKEESKEEKQWKKDRKRSIRMLYLRICALCHPDKTRVFKTELKSELQILFIEAKDAYTAKNLEQLAAIHATAVSIRNGTTKDERAKIKAERLDSLKRSLKGLLSELDAIKGCAMYAVYQAHHNGQKGTAQAIYASILHNHMNSRIDALQQAKAIAEKLKKANQNV